MANSPEDKHFGTADAQLAAYVRETFQVHDPFLESVRERAAAAGLPVIHVGRFDARHLEVLVAALNARKIVEVGTLAGLSGTALARALPPGGVLHTFEFAPKHAEVAQETFRQAGVADRVRLHVGPALENLPRVEAEGPFDLVFIDADKLNYLNYLQWAARNLRPGGTVLIDNAFAWGKLVLDDAELSEEDRAAKAAIHGANHFLANSGLFKATMLPTGEGLAMGVRVA